MPQIVSVPGHGNVQFPDGMDNDAISTAIQENFPELAGPKSPEQKVTEAESSALARSFLDYVGETYGQHLRNIAEAPNLVLKGAVKALNLPYEALGYKAPFEETKPIPATAGWWDYASRHKNLISTLGIKAAFPQMPLAESLNLFPDDTTVGEIRKGITEAAIETGKGFTTPEMLTAGIVTGAAGAIPKAAGAIGKVAATIPRAMQTAFAMQMTSTVPEAAQQAWTVTTDPNQPLSEKSKAAAAFGAHLLMTVGLMKSHTETPPLTRAELESLGNEMIQDWYGQAKESVTVRQAIGPQPFGQSLEDRATILRKAADIISRQNTLDATARANAWRAEADGIVARPGAVGIETKLAERPGGGPAIGGKVSFAAEAPTLATQPLPERTQRALRIDTDLDAALARGEAAGLTEATAAAQQVIAENAQRPVEPTVRKSTEPEKPTVPSRPPDLIDQVIESAKEPKVEPEAPTPPTEVPTEQARVTIQPLNEFLAARGITEASPLNAQAGAMREYSAMLDDIHRKQVEAAKPKEPTAEPITSVVEPVKESPGQPETPAPIEPTGAAPAETGKPGGVVAPPEQPTIAQVTPAKEPVKSALQGTPKLGEKIIHYRHKDGKGLLDRSAWDLSKLTDDEELRLPELLDYGLQQPQDVPGGSKFYFTQEGLKKHAELIRLIRKASKTGLIKEQTTLKQEPVWRSSDGQIAIKKEQPIPSPSAPKPVEMGKPVAKMQSEVTSVAKHEGKTPAKEVKAELVQRLEAALPGAVERSVWKASEHGYVEINIPGDGKFRIPRNIQAISEVRDAAKRLKTSAREIEGVPSTRRDTTRAGILKKDFADALTVYGTETNAYLRLKEQLDRADELGLEKAQRNRLDALVYELRRVIYTAKESAEGRVTQAEKDLRFAETELEKAQKFYGYSEKTKQHFGSSKKAQVELRQAQELVDARRTRLSELRSDLEKQIQKVIDLEEVEKTLSKPPTAPSTQAGGMKIEPKSSEAGAAIPPSELLVEAGKRGLELVKSGVRDFVEWSAEMLKQFGEAIRPHLQAIWDGFKEDLSLLAKSESGAAIPPLDLALAKRAELTAREKASERALAAVPKAAFGEKLPDSVMRQVSAVHDNVVGARWRFSKGTREEIEKMGMLLNVANNASADIAEQSGNQVKNSLFRAIRGTTKIKEYSKIWPAYDPNELPKVALTMMRESGEDRTRLAEFREILTDATGLTTWNPVRKSKWNMARRKALAGVEYALDQFDKLKPVSELYKKVVDTEWANENAVGVVSPYRENYVMHVQDDIEGVFDMGIFGRAGAGRGATSNFKMMRAPGHDTFAEAIASGTTPVSMDAIALLKSRVNHGARLSNMRSVVVEGLRQHIDPFTNQPLVADLVTRTVEKPVTNWKQFKSGSRMPIADEGFHISWRDVNGNKVPVQVRTQVSSPKGYAVVEYGNQRIAVLDPFARYFDAMTEPSKIANSPTGHAFLEGVTAGKHLMLAFDVFHMNRLGFWASIIQGKPTGYQKGLHLLNYDLDELRRMKGNGEITQKMLDYAVENKPIADIARKTGFNNAHVEDNLYAEFTQHLPLAGAFNRWLFTEFQRGAMTEAYIYEFKRQARQHPELTQEQVGRMVSKDLNTRFGNLLNESWLKSKQARDIARFIFLAPGWNEGLIRSEIGTVKQIPTSVIDSVRARRIVVGGLLRASAGLALANFVGNQIINLVTQGKPTWQNQGDGFEDKISAVIPDVTGTSPGLKMSPLTLPFETTEILLRRFEKTGTLEDAARQYLQTRLGVAGRPIYTFATKRDVFDRPIRPDEFWSEWLKMSTPLPISSSAFSNLGIEVAKRMAGTAQGTRQEFPGQYQKQVMATMGIKAANVPSAIAQTSDKAKKFNEAMGVAPSEPPGYGSVYTDLHRYLQMGNTEAAIKELKAIREKKTQQQVDTHFKRLPDALFTHRSKNWEELFYRHLSPEEQQTYNQAKAQRILLNQSYQRIRPVTLTMP